MCRSCRFWLVVSCRLLAWLHIMIAMRLLSMAAMLAIQELDFDGDRSLPADADADLGRNRRPDEGSLR